VTHRGFAMEFERPLVELEGKLAELREMDISQEPELADEIESLAEEIERLKSTLYTSLTPWERVQVARHPERPKTQDYVAALFEDVVELRGDRAFGDDAAIFAGFGTIDGRKVVVLGHRKGKGTKENLAYNFGMPHPEAYRKAIRVMRIADRFGLPVVTFVDTQGAYPGVGAEERGQAWAIAEAIATLAGLRVPVVTVGIGEGGSGGALAIGFGDHLIMLENAYYSVSTPEACASIIHKDPSKAQEVASALKLTTSDLTEMCLVDEVVPEPLGGAHRQPEKVIEAVGRSVTAALDRLTSQDPSALVESRYQRLRQAGMVLEES